MSKSDDDQRAAHIFRVLTAPCPPAVTFLAERLAEKYPGAAVLLYGSGNSVLSDASPSGVLFDFYVIAPSYREAYASRFLTFLNWVMPPNVFYMEASSPHGRLRAKYAVLSAPHFERLVSRKTFHSYFWARFAQPSRIVAGPDEMRPRLERCIAAAIDTFVARSAPLAGPDASPADIWNRGLSRSYKAELRAEAPDRVERLLESYGDWPDRVTVAPDGRSSQMRASLAWRLRTVQGGALSVLRLLKGTLTFDGGVDYIAWKISRHSGVKIDVRDWERRFPFFGAPFLALRYYRLRRKQDATASAGK